MGRLDPANGARPGHAIYDLGCGAGNITRILADVFRQRRSSASICRRRCSPRREPDADKRVSFINGDLAHFKPGSPPSILYSNAAYQWLKVISTCFPA